MTDSYPSDYSGREVGKRFAEVSDLGLVPIEPLEDLVEELNESAEWAYADDKAREGDSVGMCADKLQNLIEDHQ